MSENPKTISAEEQSNIMAEIHRAFRYLHTDMGFSVADILSVTHGETLSQMALIFGGGVASDCAQKAARHLASLPPHRAHAPTVPVGRVQ